MLGSDEDGSFWLQMDMFLWTKIAMVIVATRYVFWAAGMLKLLSWPLRELTALPHLAAVCRYVKTFLAYDRVLKICSWVLEKRVGRLVLMYFVKTVKLL